MPSAAEGLRRLGRAGFFVKEERSFEANSVFDQPDGSLRLERCLLRLREYGGKSILTYKGPPEPGAHKRREEIETEVGDAGAFSRLLHRLGYLVTFRYEKYRTEFRRRAETGGAVLDETPIGVWIELEGDPDWIDRVAAEMGFAPQDYVLESYGTLYLLHCQSYGIEPENMVFVRK